MFQKLTLLGTFGRDPEVRYTQDGKPIASFTFATNRNLPQNTKNANAGDTNRETTWWRVTCYGQTADYISKYGQKGAKALVDGRLVCDPETGCPKVYQRKDGTWSANFEVSAETIRIVAGYKTDGVQQRSPVLQPYQQPRQQYQQKQYPDYDVEIPY